MVQVLKIGFLSQAKFWNTLGASRHAISLGPYLAPICDVMWTKEMTNVILFEKQQPLHASIGSLIR